MTSSLPTLGSVVSDIRLRFVDPFHLYRLEGRGYGERGAYGNIVSGTLPNGQRGRYFIDTQRKEIADSRGKQVLGSFRELDIDNTDRSLTLRDVIPY